MPNTPNYGFNFESAGALPGTTLTGGPEGGNAILAQQVDSALAGVETKADNNASNITANTSDIAAVDSDLVTFTDRFQADTELVTFTSQELDTVNVSFTPAFSGVPVVFTNIASGTGPSARWDSRAISVNSSGFTLFVFSNESGVTSSWTDVPVQWMAYLPQ
jgi:hypothetical protein